jgi:hypothetical protein
MNLFPFLFLPQGDVPPVSHRGLAVQVVSDIVKEIRGKPLSPRLLQSISATFIPDDEASEDQKGDSAAAAAPKPTATTCPQRPRNVITCLTFFYVTLYNARPCTATLHASKHERSIQQQVLLFSCHRKYSFNNSFVTQHHIGRHDGFYNQPYTLDLHFRKRTYRISSSGCATTWEQGTNHWITATQKRWFGKHSDI